MRKKNDNIYNFNEDNEIDILADIYGEVYRLSMKNDNLSIIFANLSDNKYDILTIDDMSVKIKYWTYSEYEDYSLDSLDDQISLLYNDFYTKGEEWDPLIIIIHDSLNMSNCNSINDLTDCINNKLTILDVLKIYVYFTVRDK